VVEERNRYPVRLKFDEAWFQVSVALGEEIAVPAYVKEVSTLYKGC
jgi:hypothetical protein